MNPRNLSPEELLAQCRWETFRGPGPGGQKRNKTSSSVRIIHIPTGISATAGEFRSQERNKSNALLRLRHRLAIELRDPVAEAFAPTERVQRCFAGRRLRCSIRDEAYPEVLGIVLDLLHAHRGVVSETAQYLGLTTANLVGFLQRHDEALSAVNRIRRDAELRPLGGRT
jgi:hypothetical protein